MAYATTPPFMPSHHDFLLYHILAMVSKPLEETQEEPGPNWVPAQRASVRHLGLGLDENSGHTSQCTCHPLKERKTLTASLGICQKRKENVDTSDV
jgi:hypothetical protein